MKNYVSYEDFLPDIKSQKTVVITEEYTRVDSEIPFLNRVVRHRMESEGVIRSEKVGPGLRKVVWVK